MVTLRRITLPDGTEKIEVIPESPDIIKERKRLREESYKRRKERQYERCEKISALTPKEREHINFWIKVDKRGENECWIWKGNKNYLNYGMITDNINKKTILVHRLSYEIHYGSIPENMEVCHRCDNPSCVNPIHLFLGTHKDNMKDMSLKGRTRNQDGELNSMCKVPTDIINNIRHDYNLNKITRKELSELYGVSYRNVCRIVKYERRKNG